MARQLHAHLNPASLPDRAALQQALDALKLGLKIDGPWSPEGPAGYLPFTVMGEDAGVYLGLEHDQPPPQALAPEGSALTARLGLRWGGDAREQLTAVAVAAALATSFGAVVVDPDQSTLRSADALLRQARTLRDENF